MPPRSTSSLRYFDITDPADLNVINQAIQANNGNVRSRRTADQAPPSRSRPTSYARRRPVGAVAGHDRAQLSFKLKRYCTASTAAYSASFYGVPLPGSILNGTTFFSLSPSYGAAPCCAPEAMPPALGARGRSQAPR